MNDFSMDWWYNPEYGNSGATSPANRTDEQQQQVDDNENQGRGEIPEGQNEPITDFRGENPFREDPMNYNQFVDDPFNYNMDNGSYNYESSGGEEWLKRLVAALGGGVAGIVTGGSLVGAIGDGKSYYDKLMDAFGNQNWIGGNLGMMAPDSPAYLDPNAAAPPQGIMSPDSPDFLEPAARNNGRRFETGSSGLGGQNRGDNYSGAYGGQALSFVDEFSRRWGN